MPSQLGNATKMSLKDQLRGSAPETPEREGELCLDHTQLGPWRPPGPPPGLGLGSVQGQEATGFRRDAEPPGVCAALGLETSLRADASPPTFLVGIFSFKNSASLHSTFQGAWIFTNPTPWIFVWKRRGGLSQRGQTWLEAILTFAPNCRLSRAATLGGFLLCPHWPLSAALRVPSLQVARGSVGR